MNIVITGASSGIGKATAHEFARRGANITVSARRGRELDEVVKEIESLGGRGLAVASDVSDREEVARILERSLESFGSVDVWVNNAAVSCFGRFEDIPEHVYRRVVETNIIGYFNGAGIILPYFKRRKKGVLVNVSSVAGTIAEPYSAPYIATKFAVKGFSSSLRGECMGTGVKVCTVLPASIDTPMHQYAANFMGKKEKPIDPVISAGKVASAIVSLVRFSRREVHVGLGGAVLAMLHHLIPWITEPVYALYVKKGHFQKEPQPPYEGNLFEPIEGGSVDGGWRKKDET